MLAKAGAVLAAAASLVPLSGCGNTYRAVISSINPVGPATQPQKLLAVVSDPGNNQPGLITVVDFAGDTVLAVANIDPKPTYFDLLPASNGGTGYSLHASSTGTLLNNFDVSPTLKTNIVYSTTLFSDAQANALVATSAGAYVSEPGRSAIGQIVGGSPASLRQEYSVGANPQYVIGLSGSARYYAISQGTGTTGTAAAIETATSTISTSINVGTQPIYGVMSADGKRVFVVNKGSNNISVINAQANALDTAHPTLAVGTTPVWADTVSTINELLVLNQGSTTSSLSIINVPLCNANASTSNPNCDSTNPVDATDFGTVVATVPLGKNCTQVSALQDATRAYVMCDDDPTNSDASNGVVYVVNLTTNTVTARVKVSGHPNWITAVTGTPKGKVYTTARDSHLLTVIDTSTDTKYTTIDVLGNGVAVRRNAQ
nr:YncE family protein [Terriglobus tenax]